ncbi:MAG: PQQ-dependent dehydrogenase, methanol/ethanol family [Woeseia sp.]
MNRTINCTRLFSFLLPVLVAACADAPETGPETQQAMPIASLNAASPGQAPPVAQAVTSERLVRARSEPHNWLTYYGAYDGQRFSSLDEIRTGNVKNLKVAWTFQHAPMTLMAAHPTYGFEATPIVIDGVMFISGWNGYVWALDATNGKLLWEYQHAVPLDTPLCCGNINRGVAVARGKVFYATPDAHLIALDAMSGDVAWEKVFGDIRAGETATVAPLVVKNLVLVGASGGEFGVRGHIDAFDVDTGKRVWRHYTIPRPEEPGGETWGNSEAWQRGGGTTWITGTYDPELDLVYWGTGNPGPDFRGNLRPGANLFTNSVLALDPDDGTRRWHYQWTPHDLWDYDGVGENILFDRDGRKLLAHFDKNGHLFILDRTNGEFVRAVKFTETTWGDIDPNTGAMTVHLRPTPEGTEIKPGPSGGKEGFPHAAYSPKSGFLYVPVIENTATFKTGPADFKEGQPWWGGDVETLDHPQSGALKAFDPATGREVWASSSEYPMAGSVLATAGDLVFSGQLDGHFAAWDARTGEQLWRFQTGSGIHSSPITYSVDGRQYVAIPSGWGGWIAGIAPKMMGAPRGAALFVFSLP